MEQKKSWIIRETIDDKTFHDVLTVSSLADVDTWVNSQQSREAIEIKVIEVVVTEQCIAIQTIPAYVPTLEEIIANTVSGSDGSYDVYWDEDFQALTAEQKAEVEQAVWAEIASCDACGWHFHKDSMEMCIDSGDLLCWKCANDREEEEDEENED